MSRNCPADVVDAHRPQTRVDARDRPSARDTRGTTVIVTSRAFGRARVDASSVGARERANARAGRFVRDAMRATTTTTTTRAVGTDDALDVFLRDARAAFRADASEVSVSVGNEACDLDSVACAVAHAYAESASAGGIVVPIVSCAREELLLRPDVVSALANAGVSLESLTRGGRRRGDGDAEERVFGGSQRAERETVSRELASARDARDRSSRGHRHARGRGGSSD